MGPWNLVMQQARGWAGGQTPQHRTRDIKAVSTIECDIEDLAWGHTPVGESGDEAAANTFKQRSVADTRHLLNRPLLHPLMLASRVLISLSTP